jgi:hypothetical protein
MRCVKTIRRLRFLQSLLRLGQLGGSRLGIALGDEALLQQRLLPLRFGLPILDLRLGSANACMRLLQFRLSGLQLRLSSPQHLVCFLHLCPCLLKTRLSRLSHRFGFLHGCTRFIEFGKSSLEVALGFLCPRLIFRWLNQRQHLSGAYPIARIDQRVEQFACDAGADNLLVIGADGGGIGDRRHEGFRCTCSTPTGNAPRGGRITLMSMPCASSGVIAPGGRCVCTTHHVPHASIPSSARLESAGNHRFTCSLLMFTPLRSIVGAAPRSECCPVAQW